jgi:hypothetical protein
VKASAAAVWGGSTLPTAGVEGGTMLQLETSPLRRKKIRTNFRGDTIRMGEMILGSIGHSPNNEFGFDSIMTRKSDISAQLAYMRSSINNRGEKNTGLI